MKLSTPLSSDPLLHPRHNPSLSSRNSFSSALSFPSSSLLSSLAMPRVKETPRALKEAHKQKEKEARAAGKSARKQIAVKSVRKQLATKAARKAGAGSNGVVARRPHKYKPGTVSLRNIRRYQKNSTDNLLKKAHINDIVKHFIMTRAIKFDMRSTQKCRLAIQEYVESKLIRELKSAVWMNCENKVKSLDGRAIMNVWNIENILNV